MKKLLRPPFILVLVLSVGLMHANAQENSFTQYYLNMPAVNAGFTGIEDYLDLKMGVRE
jgi:hypothetical protein